MHSPVTPIIICISLLVGRLHSIQEVVQTEGVLNILLELHRAGPTGGCASVGAAEFFVGYESLGGPVQETKFVKYKKLNKKFKAHR